jgi:hypothetical protein
MFAGPLLCREFFRRATSFVFLITSSACRDLQHVPLSAVAALCRVSRLSLHRMLWPGRVSDDLAALLTPQVRRFEAGKLRLRLTSPRGDEPNRWERQSRHRLGLGLLGRRLHPHAITGSHRRQLIHGFLMCRVDGRRWQPWAKSGHPDPSQASGTGCSLEVASYRTGRAEVSGGEQAASAPTAGEQSEMQSTSLHAMGESS